MEKRSTIPLSEEIKIRAFSEKLYNNLKEFNFLDGVAFRKAFIEIVRDLKAFLEGVKKTFDEFDRSKPSFDSQIKFINTNKLSIFQILNEHFVKLTDLSIGFLKEEYRAHQLYIQKELYFLIGMTPFNKHIYEKPLGYPGDFVMMNYLYEDGYIGNSTYEKLIHRYSCEIPIAKANVNRKQFFKNEILNAISNRDDNTKIASIACGPGKELIEVLKEKRPSINLSFTFFDFEKLALEQIKSELGDLSNKFSTRFVNENIMTLVKQKQAQKIIGNQNFIYCAGLIDYMSNKLSAKIIETLSLILDPGGRLIVGNVNVGNKLASYTEMLGEWNINYRSESDMLSLASRIAGSRKIYTKHEESTGMNVFLFVEN